MSHRASAPALGPTQLPVKWVNEALSPGVRSPVDEAAHSLSSSVEVMNEWGFETSLPVSCIRKTLPLSL